MRMVTFNLFLHLKKKKILQSQPKPTFLRDQKDSDAEVMTASHSPKLSAVGYEFLLQRAVPKPRAFRVSPDPLQAHTGGAPRGPAVSPGNGAVRPPPPPLHLLTASRQVPQGRRQRRGGSAARNPSDAEPA